MQNSIIREFEDNEQVLTAVFNPGDSHSETLQWTQHFWDNNFLRGSFFYDEEGLVDSLYEQPQTGLPFGRGFIIDQDGLIDTPFFGHQPQMVIDRIYELLGGAAPMAPENLTAQIDGDDVVLMWDQVTRDIQGNLIEVEHYAIYAGEDPLFAADSLHLIGETIDSLFRVTDASGAAVGFYRVSAVMDD
jgi:hypothetical protein